MDKEVISFLNARSGASEARRVHTYRVYFGSREVTVEISVEGDGVGPHRYSVASFFTDEGRSGASFRQGNPEWKLWLALDTAHLDRFSLDSASE